ncbi:MAG: TonB-dependent receptor domain-containing protein [Vulcanimicrobiaceae bacterium]
MRFLHAGALALAFPFSFALVAFAAVTSVVLAPITASAQAVFVTGTVVDDTGHPVPGVTLRVSGQNITLTTTTDSAGRFAFQTLTVGHYMLTAAKGELHVEQSFDLSSAGLTMTVTLTALKTISHVVVTTNPGVKRSGTDVTLNATELARLPTGQSLPSILTQVPSAAQGSNGQIHINGDHNGLNYYIDGVQVPANLNRVLGTELDLSTISYLDVLEGAYPAQYGDKFAAVLNAGTKAYAGPAGYNVDVTGGSFGTYDGTFGLHTPLGSRGGSLSLASRLERNNWGIDPAMPDPVHNSSSNVNEFLRVSEPLHGLDTLNFDAINSLQTFQIPPDTKNGVPSNTDDNEYQNDTFVSLQYRHSIGDHGSLQFGPSVKISRILDTNDLANDLAAGATPPTPPSTFTCHDFTDCLFSVYANRIARDYRFNADYALKSPHHEVRIGALYDAGNINADYVITLQPFSAINPAGTFTATDASPKIGHQQEAYAQDSWTMGNDWELDYGLRMDAFQIFSTNFDNGFSQWSPRLKLTRFFGPRASAYAYYGRLFVPFSFETVNPATAAALFLSPPANRFDLRPQRDSLYELGGHLTLGSADLGFRISHKVSTDWIDDTQVGATNLHQDINFPQGRVDIQTLYIQQNLSRGGRAFFSVTHSLAVNSSVCETNLLQNCTLAGYDDSTTPPTPIFQTPGGDFAQADHDQHWDSTFATLFNDERGGWFSFNGEYGSGLSQDPSNCVPGDNINCKVPPHLTFNVEKGVSLGSNLTVALSILNLLNDRYAITLNNSLQGTHYARPRAMFLQFSTKR